MMIVMYYQDALLALDCMYSYQDAEIAIGGADCLSVHNSSCIVLFK